MHILKHIAGLLAIHLGNTWIRDELKENELCAAGTGTRTKTPEQKNINTKFILIFIRSIIVVTYNLLFIILSNPLHALRPRAHVLFLIAASIVNHYYNLTFVFALQLHGEVEMMIWNVEQERLCLWYSGYTEF